jgi:RimJ/RimL family protein N-acetyltransferase
MNEKAPTYQTLIPMFEELRGQRVLLRPYRLEDAQALKEAVEESREHIRPWLPFADRHQTIEETRDWIIHSMAGWLLREDMACGIWEVDTGQFLGGVGLHTRNWEIRYFEIGYWLRKSAEGHGYMTEAVRLVANYALNELKANRVEIRCDERNERSAAVARRLGFVQEGRLRNREPGPDGTLRTMLYFSLTPDDLHK